MMDSRERMFKVLEKSVTGDFPVVIPYMNIFLRDHWEQVTDKPWWIMNLLDVEARLEVEESMQEKLDVDWVECRMCPSRDYRESHRLRGFNQHALLIDTHSGSWEELTRPRIGGDHISYTKPIICSEEDIDELIPRINAKELIQSGRLDYEEKAIERFGSEKFIVCVVSTPFASIFHLLGFGEAIKSFFLNKNLLRHLLENLTIRFIEQLKAHAKTGSDGVFLQEVFTGADTISKNHFRKYVIPHTGRLISEAKHLGMKCIYYPCGDVSDRLEEMLEMKPDAISLEESKKGFSIDLEWVNKVVDGRVCLFGNLDAITLLPNGTIEELEKEIKRQVAVGREHGRFVMSLGSPVTPQTPTTRVREYVDLTRKLSQ